MLLHLHLYLLLLITVISSTTITSSSSSTTSTTKTAIRAKSWRSFCFSKKLFKLDAQCIYNNNKHNFLLDFYAAKRINAKSSCEKGTCKITTVQVAASAIVPNTCCYTQQQQQRQQQHPFKIGVFKRFSTFPVGTFTSSRHTKQRRLLLMTVSAFYHFGRSNSLVPWYVQARRSGFLQVSSQLSLDSNSLYNNKKYKTTQNQVSMSSSIDNNNISNDDTTTTIATVQASTTTTTTTATKPIVQYIFVRTDLKSNTNNNDDAKEETTVSWSYGAIAAQVAHASVAAIMNGLHYNDPYTKQYVNIPTNQLQNMTKLVYAVSNEQELLTIQKVWYEQQQYTITTPTLTSTPTIDDDNDTTTTTDNTIGTSTTSCTSSSIGKGYLWQEQPENIPTAFATWPVERTNAISKIIKKLKVSFY